MKNKQVIIPLPSYGFDPTECAIPWKILKQNNFIVQFATPNALPAQCDKIMLHGHKLGIWKPILKAQNDAVLAYNEMENCDEFKNPIRYEAIKISDFELILLPGGHDKGMREYLESPILQNIIADFFSQNKLVAAICHGVVLVSRSKNTKTSKSVLYNYKTTALLKSQEKLAYHLTRFWLNDYYLTYPEITVEEEVTQSLQAEKQFIKGKIPIFRDNSTKLSVGFALIDKNYISARWPGDVYNFANAIIDKLKK